ncbi:MAG: PTS sugar transporter subunit IIA [Burkholderiaceae bacterium]|nr:PTS sugar transporter subunit IIA [Burkholderiaceae bacterium]
MNSVAKLLSVQEILLDVDVSGKQALFKAVGQLWQEHRGLDAAMVAENLSAREQLGSTGLGQGIAIPHARVDGLNEAVAAFVRPKSPIPFDSPDGRPVAYCFVLLVPAEATEEHLQILAQVAEMLSSAQFRERLGSLKSADEIRQLFAGWQSA